MKKFRFTLGVLLIWTLYISCKKDNTSHSSIIDSAKAYFSEVTGKSALRSISADQNAWRINPRKFADKIPDWSKAYIKKISLGDAVIVPIHYENPLLIKSNLAQNRLYNIDDLARLFIYKDRQNTYHAEVVTMIPDSLYGLHGSSRFSGLVIVDDWFGSPVNKFSYSAGGQVKKFNAAKAQAEGLLASHNQNSSDSKRLITVCYELTGYNYSPDNPNEHYYWSEGAGCATFFGEEGTTSDPTGDDYGRMDEESGAGSGVGGDGTNTYEALAVRPGNDIITDFKDYSRCFDDKFQSYHTYQVTLCVSQPKPGTRTTWSSNPVSGGTSSANDVVGVGHTFLIVSQSSPTQTIVRNAGFYPATNVDPLQPMSIGNLNNDEIHDYNISLSINITNGQLTSLLYYLNQAASSKLVYDLNSYNCTTFALNALSSIGVTLPRTTGKWPNGQGLNPGDLGEDIREMTLSPNMTRSTENAWHLNKGACN